MSNIAVASTTQDRATVGVFTGLVRVLFLPIMWIGFGGTGLWLASRDAPKWQLVALLAGAIGVTLAAERVAPYRAEWNRSRGDARRDVAHAAVNESLQVGSLLILPAIVGAFSIEGLWPGSWPFVLQVLVSVTVLDAGITLGHWWSHRAGPLWRLHAVHHSVERFYGVNGLMKHPLHQLFETGLATTPLVLFGLPVDVATALVVLVALQLLVQHSNVDHAAGPAHHVMATNRVHRFHHLRWPGVGDVNFGLFFTVWDRMLGTYVWDPRARFDSSVLGIAAEPRYPAGYLRQLLEPFRPYRPEAVEVPEQWR